MYEHIYPHSVTSDTPTLPSSDITSFVSSPVSVPTSYPDAGSPLQTSPPLVPNFHESFEQCPPSPLTLLSLNRSSEFLATLPRTSTLNRHPSIKTRTLPPLPSQPSNLLSRKSFMSSQPQLDEACSEMSDSIEQKRRLSNSMDCLVTEDIDSTSTSSMTNLDQLEVQPYLKPVDIHKVVEKEMAKRYSNLCVCIYAHLCHL